MSSMQTFTVMFLLQLIVGECVIDTVKSKPPAARILTA